MSEASKGGLKRTVLPALFAFCTIYVVALLTSYLSPCPPQSPVIACSMGASAVIVFITPNSPFATPWSLIGGHFFSALIGISCAISLHDTAFAAAVAVGGAMLSMQVFRCMNPPGAATALAPVIALPYPDSFSYYLILPAIMINVAVLVVISGLINRLLRITAHNKKL
jgi:CBS domain-containing membrane protein